MIASTENIVSIIYFLYSKDWRHLSENTHKNDSDILNFIALVFCLKVLEQNAFCRFA